MSLNMPTRRVLATGLLRHTACSAVATTTTTTTTTATTTAAAAAPSLALRPRTQPLAAPTRGRALLHTTPARAVDWRGFFGRRKKQGDGSASDGITGDLSRTKTRNELRDRLTSSDIGASPLLAGEMEQAEQADIPADGSGGRRRGGARRRRGKDGAPGPPSSASHARSSLGTSLLPTDLQRALDPDPRSRVRWERKMTMRHVGRMLDPAGCETRAERLARTERVLLHKSAPLPTSTKKLMHLARQIAGKTLEEALVQMRFSKKKMAKEVTWHLVEARDRAVVERGMGLGPVQKRADADAAADADPESAITIQTKDGRWLAITDPTRIYIDQAWVTKGEWRAATPEYRARGRINMLWSPSSFLSVVLKEEKTRIRLHNERVAKEERKAPWVHLPNRPVTAQRPYYSW